MIVKHEWYSENYTCDFEFVLFFFVMKSKAAFLGGLFLFVGAVMMVNPTTAQRLIDDVNGENVASVSMLAVTDVTTANSGIPPVAWTRTDASGDETFTDAQHMKEAECNGYVSLDGYNYPVVRIGHDCWFRENLKASTGISGAVAYKGKASNKDKFGLLYSWQAAVSGPATATYVQGICPDGWGIPTVEDLQNLYASANNDVSRLKNSDPTAWTAGKCGKAPSTGFDLLGAGYFESEQCCFEDLLHNTILWTSSAGATNGTAVCCEFNDYCQKPMFKEISTLDKVSVRCIRKN